MLLRRTLARIPSNLDKREGSVIYLAVAPMIAELAQAYIQMDVILQETFADTASREYLIRRAAERGLEPYPATCAVLRGTFDCDVPIGSRFYIDTLHYTVIEKEASGTYRLQCEEPGEEGNTRFGQMIPVEYITGLKKAELTELLIPGTAEEDTEVFRERYFASFDSLAFGGNRADYKEKVMGLGGVGDVKVYRATAEDGSPMAGHVKIVVLDASWDIPDKVLLEEIQEALDPGPEGEGNGLAPIGHIVHVCPAIRMPVTVRAQLSCLPSAARESIQQKAEQAVEDYLLDLRKQWGKEDNLVVRISQINNGLLGIDGVIDVTGTTINGEEKNLVLESDAVPGKEAVYV